MRFTIIAIATLFFASQAGAAAAEQAKSVPCGVNMESIRGLYAVQGDPLLEYQQKVQKELSIRKTLLKNLVDCAIEETRNLQKDFESADESDAGVGQLKHQFSGWFPSTINYYNLQKNSIDALGLAGSKEFAANLEEWRNGNYKTTASIVSNFILWSKNQSLMQTAKNRLNQATLAIELLKITPEYWKIKELLNETDAEVRKALLLNQKAKEAIRTYAPPEESLSITKESLGVLSGSYQKLLELVDEIKKALEEK